MHDEFDRVVERSGRRKHRATDLQVAPLLRAMNAVENENHAPLESLEPHLHEVLEERCIVEIEQAGQGLDMEWPGFEPLDPIPERLLPYRHLGVHLGAQNVAARVECPVAVGRLFRKVQGRADTEIGPAAAIDEVMHHLRAIGTTDFLAVILEIMCIPGYGNPDVVARQETIERRELFRRFRDIMSFRCRGKIPPAGEARMADDGHSEFAATSAERAL